MTRIIFILTLTIGFFSLSYAQDKELDSLLNILKTAGVDTNKVKTLNIVSKKYLSIDPEISVLYGQQSSELALKLNFNKGLADAYNNIAVGYLNAGKDINALKYFENSLEVSKSINDQRGISLIFNNMAVIFSNKGEDSKALEMILKSLKISEETFDTLHIIWSLVNAGAIYAKKEQTYDKALQFYRLAYPLCKEKGSKGNLGILAVNIGEIFMNRRMDDSALHYFNISLEAVEGTENEPYTLNDVGLLYRLQHKYDKAIEIQIKACQIAQQLSKDDLATSLVGLAQSYQAKGNMSQAQETYLEAEKVANENKANYTLRDIYQGLSEIFTHEKNFRNASMYQSLLLGIKDSIYNIETDRKLGTLQFTYDLEKKETKINLLTKDQQIKEKEISRQKIVRNSFIGGFAIVLIFAGIFFRQRNRIKTAKKRSDELLLNILPEETAEELKETGTAKAKKFDMVSVMFTDFKNFTQASEKLSPEELVREIDNCFSVFDSIITKYHIEKIKTIGDAYMCASGLPVPCNTHAEDIIKAGLEMQEFIERNKKEKQAKGQTYFELRVGIHSGSVVAGVVGIKKFAYDIWGDAVNTASRMESSGEVGKVNISGSTFELVKDKFNCVHRGRIQAKNKGEIDMYFVEGNNSALLN